MYGQCTVQDREIRRLSSLPPVGRRFSGGKRRGSVENARARTSGTQSCHSDSVPPNKTAKLRRWLYPLRSKFPVRSIDRLIKTGRTSGKRELATRRHNIHKQGGKKYTKVGVFILVQPVKLSEDLNPHCAFAHCARKICLYSYEVWF